MSDFISADEVLGRMGGGSSPPAATPGPSTAPPTDGGGFISSADVMKHIMTGGIGGGPPGTEPDVPQQGGQNRWDQFVNKLNTGLASVLGIPGDVAAYLVQDSLWNSLPEDTRQRIRESHPGEAAAADSSNRMADLIRQHVGTPGVLRGMESAGAINPNITEPQTQGERVAAVAGTGAAEGVKLFGAAALASPEAALAEEWARGSSVMAGVARNLVGSIKEAGLLGNFLMGAGGGAGGELAREQAPDWTKPTAELAGNVAGAGVAATADATIRQGFRAVGRALSDIFAPAGEKAAVRMQATAENPERLRTTLANRPENELTVGQATADPKLLQMESELASTKHGAPVFQAQRAKQNQDWLNRLESMSPAESAEEVRSYVRDQLRSIEVLHDQHVAKVRGEVGRTLEEAGGTLYANPSEYGEEFQGRLSSLQQRADEETRRLWNSIDPTGKVAVDLTTLKSDFEGIAGQVEKLTKLSGEERDVLSRVSDLNDQEPLREVVALRNRLVDSVRAAKGDSRARLQDMLGATDRALADKAAQLMSTSGPSRARLLSGLKALNVVGQAQEAEAAKQALYEQGPVGQVLRPGSDGSKFQVSARAVADNLFDSPERLRAFMAASEGDSDLPGLMQDWAAFSMRQYAARDGVVSPTRLQQWVSQHKYALDQFPELADKFKTVKSAQDNLDLALINQRQALYDYQSQAVRRLVGGQDPRSVVAGAIRNQDEWSALVDRVRGSPQATDGLKRAAAEWMIDQLRLAGTKAAVGQAGASAQGADVLARNRQALSQLFSPAELSNMDRVLMEVRAAARKVPAGVEQKDYYRRVAFGLTGKALFYMLVGAEAFGHHMIGAPIGYLAGRTMEHMVEHQEGKVGQVLADMMVDKRLADFWLSRVTAKEAAREGFRESLARRWRAVEGRSLVQGVEALSSDREH